MTSDLVNDNMYFFFLYRNCWWHVNFVYIATRPKETINHVFLIKSNFRVCFININHEKRTGSKTECNQCCDGKCGQRNLC